jgi:HAD superfamily hydrolase (TIGR01549 family)
MREVLEPLEDGLDSFGDEEVNYMDYYEGAWRRAGLDVPRDLLWRVLDLEQRCWDRSVRLAPDALETLAALRGRGLRLGIASNAPFPPAMLHRQLRVNGLEEAVDVAVFSSEVGRRKPAPELYQAALGRLDVAPAEVLHVGDRVLEDYEGPRRLGMQAVLCTTLARERPPDGIPTIGRLSELVDYLHRLWLFFWGRKRRGFPGLLVGLLVAAILGGLLYGLPGGADLSRWAFPLTLAALVLLILASLVLVVVALIRPPGRRRDRR